MVLMSSRVAPASDSARSFATASVAGCLPLIHSRMAQESRTRVFTPALLVLEACELFHQVATGCLQASPSRALREDDFLPADLQCQPGALPEVQGLPDLLRDCDLSL